MWMRVRGHHGVRAVSPYVSVLEVLDTFADTPSDVATVLAVAVVGGAYDKKIVRGLRSLNVVYGSREQTPDTATF